MAVLLDNFETGTRTFTTTGNWAVSTAAVYAGTQSFKSAAIGDGGSSTATITISVPGGVSDAVLSFWRYVSSESGYDFLTITLDGVQIIRISGTNGWTQYTSGVLAPGDHTLQLTYSKDGSVSSGSDAGFIDDLQLTYTDPISNWTQNAADTAALTEGIALETRRGTTADSITLADAINGAIITAGWGFETWGAGKWDIVAYDAADSITLADALAKKIKQLETDTLALADSLTAKAKLSINEAVALTDSLLKTITTALGDDNVSLSDSVAPRSLIMFTDSLALADSLLYLMEAVRGDTASVADLLAAGTRRRIDDFLALESAALPGTTQGDILYKKARPLIAETIAATDALALAVAAYRTDTAALADSLAAATGKTLADTLSLVDAVVNELRKGGLDDAVALTDDFFRQLDTSIGSDQENALDALSASLDASLGTDSASLSESFVLSVAVVLADLMSATDAIKAKASDVNSDTAAPTDGLSLKTKIMLADTLSLADSIATKYKTAAPTWGAFDFGAFDSSQYDGEQTDRTSATDDISISKGLGVLADDLLALADSIKSSIEPKIAEAIAQADAYSFDVQVSKSDSLAASDAAQLDIYTQLADLLNLTDAVVSSVAALAGNEAVNTADAAAMLAKLVADTEALAIADSFLIGQGRLLGDVISLTDEQMATVSKVSSDTVVVTEYLALKAKAQATDVLGLAEALAIKAQLSGIDDAINMVDDISRLMRIAAGSSFDMGQWDISEWGAMGESVGVGDAIYRLLRTSYSELLGLTDSYSLKAQPQYDEVVSLADILNEKAAAAAADILSLGAETLQALIKSLKADSTALSDLLSSSAGYDQPTADTQSVTDAIIAALIMSQRADDLLDALDAATLAFKKWIGEQLPLIDETYFDMQKALAEAATIAELLGISTKRPYSDNGVGMIDETYLRAALGLPTDGLILEGDAIKGVIKQMLQQVFIEGVSVPVTGLSVSHSSSSRISSCRFRIPSPTPEVLALAQQRAEVKVYLLDGNGNTDYFSGRIVGNPTRARGVMTTEMEVTVDDWTAASQDCTVIEILNKDFGTLDYVVKYLWGKYYSETIDLSEVVATDKRVELLPFMYMSLFEATERIAQLLGWVWYVEWDGAQRKLKFYPPSAAIVPVTLSRENRNIVAGTARFGQDSQIVNSLYVFGGEAISAPRTERSLADGEAVTYKFTHKVYKDPDLPSGGVTVSVGGVAKTVGIAGTDDPADFDVLIDFDNGAMNWEEWNRPAKDAVIERTYKYLYPIVVHMEDAGSIAKYGKIERTITDTTLKTAAAARDFARSYLRSYGMPKGYGSCEVYEPGLRAGQFITVDLPAYNIVGLFEIVEVDKWIQGSTLRRKVTLNYSDNPEARIADRLKDFAQRLATMEASLRPNDLVIQKVINGTGNIKASASIGVDARIYDAYDTVASLPKEEQQMILRVAGAPKLWQYDRELLEEKVTKKIKPKTTEAATAVADTIGGGITFFDKHTFGDAAHPFGM